MVSKITILGQEISYYYELTNHKHTLFFIHGFGSSKNAIIQNLSKFQNRNYNIIAMDSPGFGASKTQKEQNIENFQAITKLFVKKVVPNHTAIMGHSLGTLSAISIFDEPKIIDIFLMSSINP
jgi:pimeloyl-ACP methyl ester carboxylesterase